MGYTLEQVGYTLEQAGERDGWDALTVGQWLGEVESHDGSWCGHPVGSYVCSRVSGHGGRHAALALGLDAGEERLRVVGLQPIGEVAPVTDEEWAALTVGQAVRMRAGGVSCQVVFDHHGYGHACSRLAGHSGPHVALASREHQGGVWALTVVAPPFVETVESVRAAWKREREDIRAYVVEKHIEGEICERGTQDFLTEFSLGDLTTAWDVPVTLTVRVQAASAERARQEAESEIDRADRATLGYGFVVERTEIGDPELTE